MFQDCKHDFEGQGRKGEGLPRFLAFQLLTLNITPAPPYPRYTCSFCDFSAVRSSCLITLERERVMQKPRESDERAARIGVGIPPRTIHTPPPTQPFNTTSPSLIHLRITPEAY